MSPSQSVWDRILGYVWYNLTSRAFGAVSCIFIMWMSAGSELLFAQAPHAVHGHVFHATGHTPCSHALIQAWPCGTVFSADLEGWFEAVCPEGLDSLTVAAHGFARVSVAVMKDSHLDIALSSLSVTLEDAAVRAHSSEDVSEAQVVQNAGDLMTTLDRVPGVRSLDLGAGLIQPVLRGLMGSRVAVLEDGVPQVGGRWGADHGVLLDPSLYDGTEWVPGGGQVWLSPEAMGGGVRLRALEMLAHSGSRTQIGAGYRAGDSRSRIHVLHRERRVNFQWHAGASVTRFGDRNVPQTEFSYIGRVYDLPDGRLPNTGGRAGHLVLGARWDDQTLGRFSLDLRASDVLQGLFPGIIGIPTQSELRGDGDRYTVELPNQQAQRIQLGGKWIRPGALDRTIRWSVSRNLRVESAPPHAHGYGPEPDSDLSLKLEERHAFIESRWEGIHGAFGVQVERLNGQTSGWEFLLPNHSRTRLSFIAERKLRFGRIGFRSDGLHLAHDGYVEPLYASDGAVVGDDVRSYAMNRAVLGGSLHFNRNFHLGKRMEGNWTATAYSRAPDSYSLAANGIHHGTFRFEQGNPDLRPERSFEIRAMLGNHDNGDAGWCRWSVRGFAALHDGFIHLTPTARFAPIVHAGQIYAFEALDAFRSGGEIEVDIKLGKGSLSSSASVLGQWALETGLGLPFTSPLDVRTGIQWPLGETVSFGLRHRAIAAANLTARNESATPGASLWGCELQIRRKQMTLSADVDNLMNLAWLDHVSAYRTLGLVTQGRWASFRLAFDVVRLDDRS